MTDCKEKIDYKNTYDDLEILLLLADDYGINITNTKNTIEQEINRIIDAVNSNVQSNNQQEQNQKIETIGTLTSLKPRVKCFLEKLFDVRRGGGKKTRQNKKTRQKRRKSSKRS
jgi:hypothetical protein